MTGPGELPGDRHDPPIACSLEAGQVGDRIAEWRALLDHVLERKPVDGGVRLRFAGGPGLAAAIAELAAREHECCPFFGFALRIDAAGLFLDVRAPDAAGDAVTTLFGDVERVPPLRFPPWRGRPPSST